MTKDLTKNDAMQRVEAKTAFYKEAGSVTDHAAEARHTVEKAVMDHVADKEAVYQQLNSGKAAKTTREARTAKVMERVNEKEALYRRLAGDE